MQRGAMLAVQEPKALTIEHEPTGRALTQFKPEEVRSDLGKIEVLAGYGMTLRDDTKLYELAVKKLEVVVDIVDWLDRYMRTPGRPSQSGPAENNLISVTEALETLGYSSKSNGQISSWRALAKAAKIDTDAAINKIVNGWKMRAGMLAPPEKQKKENEDRDLAVEAIFRAYTKLDPDQRIELKQKIMAFEKSYKDPFKDVKEW